MRRTRWSAGLGPAALALLLACALPAACGPRVWVRTSSQPLAPLDHPPVEAAARALAPGVEAGYRFAVFGDQRALADGEWQEMMGRIAALRAADRRLLFLIDTGDIVDDGRHSDQFLALGRILAPARDLPYLVGVGNHELHNNRGPSGRDNTARFLARLDPAFGTERMYYEKRLGPARFLFLDSNDLVYGDDGGGRSFERASRQLDWLVEALAAGPGAATTVAVIHHPFLQTSAKHRAHARRLWALAHRGRTLPQILIEGGVDLVFAGHTHSYELLRLERGGRTMRLLNVSGRPRGFYASSRRVRDVRGREAEHFRSWPAMAGWAVAQEDLMPPEAANQFVVVDVAADGSLAVRPWFLDRRAPGGLRPGAGWELKAAGRDAKGP
jgi:hypothetical protein